MLPTFVDNFKKANKAPNMTALAKSGMPKGWGRKGGVPPRKKAKMTIPELRIPLTTPALQEAPPTQLQVPHISIPQGQSLPLAVAAAAMPSPPFLQCGSSQLVSCQNTTTFGNGQSVTAFGNGAGVYVSQTMQEQPSSSSSTTTPFNLHFISGNIVGLN